MSGTNAGKSSATERISETIDNLAEEIEILLDGLEVRYGQSQTSDIRARLSERFAANPAKGSREFERENVYCLSGKDRSIEQTNATSDLTLPDFIKNILQTGETLSVQQILDISEDAGFAANRKTLIVTLHRMRTDKSIVSPSRGHYRLATETRDVI